MFKKYLNQRKLMKQYFLLLIAVALVACSPLSTKQENICDNIQMPQQLIEEVTFLLNQDQMEEYTVFYIVESAGSLGGASGYSRNYTAVIFNETVIEGPPDGLVASTIKSRLLKQLQG